MKAVILCIFMLSVIVSCFAQTINETITITTYYPSPYGVYRNLQLFPSDEPPADSPALQPGVMYFNKTEEKLFIYKNSTAGWVPVGGEASAGDALVNSAHSQLDCTNAGGNVTDTDVGLKQCQFNAAVCPSGWARYKAYSTLGSATCNACASSCCGSGCTVGPRGWMDLSGSPQCTCRVGLNCRRPPYGGDCSGCQWCTDNSGIGYDRHCTSTDFYLTVTAPVIQIGCY